MKTLPTTTTAVDADLRARADFRGIDEAGRVHYLLGMCECLLAQANAEILRLRAEYTPEPGSPAAIMRAHLAEFGR